MDGDEVQKVDEEEERRYWDLSAYEGIELVVGKGDGKAYTFIVRDEVQRGKRKDGRDKAGISWEVEFAAPGDGEDQKGSEEGMRGEVIWVPWTALKATYRGKEIDKPGKLKVDRIRRLGIMMRR